MRNQNEEKSEALSMPLYPIAASRFDHTPLAVTYATLWARLHREWRGLVGPNDKRRAENERGELPAHKPTTPCSLSTSRVDARPGEDAGLRVDSLRARWTDSLGQFRPAQQCGARLWAPSLKSISLRTFLMMRSL